MVEGWEIIISCCKKECCKKSDNALHMPVERKEYMWEGQRCSHISEHFPSDDSFTLPLNKYFLRTYSMLHTVWKIRESVVNKIVKVPTLTNAIVLQIKLKLAKPLDSYKFKNCEKYPRKKMQVILYKHITSGHHHIGSIRKGFPKEMSFQLIWKGWVGSEELCRWKEKKIQWPWDGKDVHHVWETKG